MSASSLPPLFIIDVDATGIDPNIDRVIQLSALSIASGERFTRLVGQVGLVSTAITRSLGISTVELTRAPKFGTVMTDLLEWFSEQQPKPDSPDTPDTPDTLATPANAVHLVAHNGHRFVFPILTKEMRRYKIPIQHTYILWDFIYTLRQYGSTSLYDQETEFQSVQKPDCQGRIDLAINLFSEYTEYDLDDPKGYAILKKDNEEQIQANPQPAMETKFIRIN